MVQTPPNIQMVDLQSQYQRLKPEIDVAMQEVVDSAAFIKGPALKNFEANLAKYLGVKHAIGVANGTDALQIALMALGLKPGDEVIVPAFTYVATAEVIGLLGLIPVMVDVHADTFNIDAQQVEKAITKKTKAIVPVHLFGQSADMESINTIAKKYNLYVVEDNAQAIGADFLKYEGVTQSLTSAGSVNAQKTGTLGDIGCTSFFPSKNLGCFGDGGALFTNNDELAENIRMIANHGQKKKYYHSVLGVNSRLDTLQAAVLDVKLKHLDDFTLRRRQVADHYDKAFQDLSFVETPKRSDFSTHVFHQYTLKVKDAKRDVLQEYLRDKEIPSVVYYPLPLHKQKAYQKFSSATMPVAERLSTEVLSLPIHTEMEDDIVNYIAESIRFFYA
jgi:UDP-2-acetamido-2-deoxy-ribo-hexuluronate aminotransferase